MLNTLLTLPTWQLLLCISVFFGLGGTAGILIMAIMQIDRIAEPVGIVEDSEEEVLP